MKLVELADRFKQDIYLLYLSVSDRRTPAVSKILLIILLAYVVSPVDLIPDFIPIIGLLDELILIPVMLSICMKLIPAELEHELRQKSVSTVQLSSGLPIFGVILVLLIWIAVFYGIISLIQL